jgi:hypothetical protein
VQPATSPSSSDCASIRATVDVGLAAFYVCAVGRSVAETVESRRARGSRPASPVRCGAYGGTVTDEGVKMHELARAGSRDAAGDAHTDQHAVTRAYQARP